MGPGHHFRFMRDFQGTFEITSRALHVRIVGSYFRQDKERPALVFVLFVQRLLRQLLRAFGITRRELLFGRDQQLALCGRERCNSSVSEVEQTSLCCAFPFFSQIDSAYQVAIRIAEAGRVLLKAQQNLIKIWRQNETLPG